MATPWATIVQIFDDYTTFAIIVMALVWLLAYRWYLTRIKNKLIRRKKPACTKLCRRAYLLPRCLPLDQVGTNDGLAWIIIRIS